MCEISLHKHDDRCVEREPLRRAADPRSDAQNLGAYHYTLRRFARGLLKMTRPLLLVISEPGLAALRGGKAAPPRRTQAEPGHAKDPKSRA